MYTLLPYAGIFNYIENLFPLERITLLIDTQVQRQYGLLITVFKKIKVNNQDIIIVVTKIKILTLKIRSGYSFFILLNLNLLNNSTISLTNHCQHLLHSYLLIIQE